MVGSEGDEEGRIHDVVVFFISCRVGVVGLFWEDSLQRTKPTMEAQRLQ